MTSLAIVRASDILKLRATLIEMSVSGLEFENKPKEINPRSTEKILSRVFASSNTNYEVCALIPIVQDSGFSQDKIKNLPPYSDVVFLGSSHELFNNFKNLIPALPDLVLPDVNNLRKSSKQSKEKPSSVYLGIFVDRKVEVETGSGSIHNGVLKHADSIGVLFEPEDNDRTSIFITWHDIKKIKLPRKK
ncbi:MAG: DUF356 domain-containing protein [Candidatus Methanoperedenaceae archaeon]|nr:DUF356 domain-containing protein [Candidatus Methanoperedenaceae archaeon]